MMHHPSNTGDDRAPRSVARVAQETSPAEEIPALLAELFDGVETRESIVTHRRVRRGPGREIAVPDVRPYRTTGPGLLAQLGVVAASRPVVAPVEVRRWESDHAPGEGCREKCAHGRWVLDRTEQRLVPARVVPGAAVPQGSPGWDADGALSPMTAGGKPDAAEPITQAWHTGDEIRAELAALGQELHDAGWRPPATLVTIALDDPNGWGTRIVRRLRALVTRARIAADYDAPIVALRDLYCPDCGGEMRVRQDASSAVWCAGSWTINGPALPGDRWPLTQRCGASWPRGSWVRLLEDATTTERTAS